MARHRADPLWVAFLRGMNLGGRRLTNVELPRPLLRLAGVATRTSLASGNDVVVDGRPEDELALALEEGLEATLGSAVPVCLRSDDEVRSIAAATPFSEAEEAASSGKPQVIFLRRALPAHALRQAESLIPEGDLLVPAGRSSTRSRLPPSLTTTWTSAGWTR